MEKVKVKRRRKERNYTYFLSPKRLATENKLFSSLGLAIGLGLLLGMGLSLRESDISAFMRAYNVYKAPWIGYCLIFAISVFLVSFTIGPGPLCYFITSEMIGQHARSSGQSWAAFVQMSCRTLILVFYLPLSNTIGSDYSYLVLFVLPMAYCFIFFYYFLPETKNRNLLEVEEEIVNLPRLPFSRRQTYSADQAQDQYDRRDLRQVF